MPATNEAASINRCVVSRFGGPSSTAAPIPARSLRRLDDVLPIGPKQLPLRQHMTFGPANTSSRFALKAGAWELGECRRPCQKVSRSDPAAEFPCPRAGLAGRPASQALCAHHEAAGAASRSVL